VDDVVSVEILKAKKDLFGITSNNWLFKAPEFLKNIMQGTTRNELKIDVDLALGSIGSYIFYEICVS